MSKITNGIEADPYKKPTQSDRRAKIASRHQRDDDLGKVLMQLQQLERGQIMRFDDDPETTEEGTFEGQLGKMLVDGDHLFNTKVPRKFVHKKQKHIDVVPPTGARTDTHNEVFAAALQTRDRHMAQATEGKPAPTTIGTRRLPISWELRTGCKNDVSQVHGRFLDTHAPEGKSRRELINEQKEARSKHFISQARGPAPKAVAKAWAPKPAKKVGKGFVPACAADLPQGEKSDASVHYDGSPFRN
jgi:hypothetical protein